MNRILEVEKFCEYNENDIRITNFEKVLTKFKKLLNYEHENQSNNKENNEFSKICNLNNSNVNNNNSEFNIIQNNK